MNFRHIQTNDANHEEKINYCVLKETKKRILFTRFVDNELL